MCDERVGHRTGLFAGIVIVVIFAGAAFPASGGVNEQVAPLNLDTARLADVIALLGAPQRYFFDGTTFSLEDLPATYLMDYGGFEVLIQSGRTGELRFENEAAGYVWRDGIVIGSTLTSVLAQLGQPSQTVVGQPCEFLDGVLYKDIDGQTGFCYYRRSDLNVRLFFGGYVVSAIYVTRSDFDNPDTDGDGLSDITESAFGSDSTRSDTDDDRLSDLEEAGYDGDAADYNPYNSILNPGGTDLDLRARDTDGDGVDDAMEIGMGTNPLDPGEVPSLPSGTRSALLATIACIGMAGRFILLRKGHA